MFGKSLCCILLIGPLSAGVFGCQKEISKATRKTKSKVKSERKPEREIVTRSGVMKTTNKSRGEIPMLSVSGIIQFEDGKPAGKTTVHAVGPRAAEFTTDDDGKFSLGGQTGLIPGHYEFAFETGKQRFAAVVTVEKSTNSLVVTMKPEKQEDP